MLRGLLLAAESSWRPVSSSVLQAVVLGLISFNIFISDQDKGIASTLSKFSEDTKLKEVDDAPESCAAIQ